MTRYRRLGRIRKRYLRQLRLTIEPRLRVERAKYLEERRARRRRTPAEQAQHLRARTRS